MLRFRAPVPKTTIHKKGDAPALEYKVRFSKKRLATAPAANSISPE
jgi:hypothetical protein